MHKNRFSNQYQALIDQKIKELLTFSSDPENQLYEAARYAVFSGGKRLRPKLALATLEALKGNISDGLTPASAIEFIHSYSMIHDDLPCMDDDDFRRGKPTVHKQFDEACALLAGDFLLTYAFEVLSESPGLSSNQKIELIKTLSQRAGGDGMIGGQLLDLEAENTPISLEHLKRIHKKKTAELLTCAVEFGGIIGNANPKQMDALRQFGESIGLAYQIMDDVIDVTESVKKHGKTISSDVANGKTTYVSKMGIEQAKQEAHILLDTAMKKISTLPFPEPLAEMATALIERTY